MRVAPLVFSVLVACSTACSAPQTHAGAYASRGACARPATWAAPIAREGVPNLHRVAPGLYRSAQPTPEGLRALPSLGVRTVVNLRAAHSDEGALQGGAIRYEAIPMVAWRANEDALVAFLRVAMDPAKQPVLVHCQHGADRTGTAVAMYRMVAQGWSREEAIDEMRHGGFGFHEEWSNLITFLRDVDVERVKRRVAARE